MYHVYNRGNNRQKIFYNEDHYIHFLRLVNKTVAPCCDILVWCLMPNHFHFLVAANELSVEIISDNSFPRQRLSQEVKQLLSSYTKAVNKQMGFTGSIFQQKTKAICVNADPGYSYANTAFHYIHQNPMKAGLVKRKEDYAYSSFQDYIGKRNGRLCNRSLAIKLLDIDERFFYKESYAIIPGEAIKNIIDSKYL